MIPIKDRLSHPDAFSDGDVAGVGQAGSGLTETPPEEASGVGPPGSSTEGNAPQNVLPGVASKALSMTTDATLGIEGNGWSSAPQPAAARANPLAVREDQAVDSMAGRSSPRTQAVRFGPPPRVAERPRVEDWKDDELLTLPEAVALFWPRGPLTVTSLRTAGHEGSLEITVVAGKHFVTPAAIRSMGKREAKKATVEPETPVLDPSADLLRRLAEARSAAHQHRRRASR